MPVDLHAIRVIAGMPLRHEILVPRAKDFGIGGTGRRPFPPDLRGADSERRVDHPADGLAQRVFLDKTPPHIGAPGVSTRYWSRGHTDTATAVAGGSRSRGFLGRRGWKRPR